MISHRIISCLSRIAIITALLLSVFVGGKAHEVDGKVRIPVDSVGYALYPEQMTRLLAMTDSIESGRYGSNASAFPKMRSGKMLGAVCPHDDYLYAAPAYVHVMREVRARILILIGVSHAARRRGIQGKLVFDTFDTWRGPYGDIAVSPMRGDVIDSLPEGLVLVSDELHAGEHSLEALIPFIQHYEIKGGAGHAPGKARHRPGIEILPILVTRLGGGLFDEAVDALSSILASELEKRGLKLGDDALILISADCVHYGDENWGGRDYAPFGTDANAYERGVEQDLDIIEETLAGPLSRERIALFTERVARDDLEWPYKVTWCGVYSIPFGLGILDGICTRMDIYTPEGYLLRYATSRSPGRLPLDETGLGVTNISTLRHWVGYAAVGYW